MVALVTSVILVIASAIVMFFTMWAAPAFIVLISFVMLPLVYVLRAVTRNVSDAPASALDEFDLADDRTCRRETIEPRAARKIVRTRHDRW